MKTLLYSGLAVGLSAALVAGVHDDTARTAHSLARVELAAASQDLGATVLTLEGGLVGIQHILHFTPLQLQGSLCKSPDVCRPVDYPAWPLGEYFNRQGAARLIDAVNALPDSTPAIPFGHSQGGQVIYAAVRQWTADPATAPDPSRLSWVSIGNPENAVGGVKRQDGLPPDTPYQGTEVIKQYDGWADWPTGTMNLVAWLNAMAGRRSAHVWGYFDVNLDDPANIRYTPDAPNGDPGNITYVFVPNDTLPLVAMTGILAPLLNPILDPVLRPIVESAYDRPFPVPTPQPGGSIGSGNAAPAAQAVSPVRLSAAAKVTRPERQSAPPAAVTRTTQPGAVRKRPAAATARPGAAARGAAQSGAAP